MKYWAWKVEDDVKESILLRDWKQREEQERQERERIAREAHEAELAWIAAIGAIDESLGQEILDSVNLKIMTNPYLMVKRGQKDTKIYDSESAGHTKTEFDKGKSTISKIEKMKQVIGWEEPKHSSLPVVKAHTEIEVVNL